ncbi:MAG: hypothetical protein ACOWWR_07385 [Eubacteriales bacterium]
MNNLKALTTAIGDLEEEAVLGMLKEFMATNPSEEDAHKVVAAC